MTKQEVIIKIQEVLAKESENPAEEIAKLGRSLIGISDALNGLTVAECRATLNAVSALNEVTAPNPKQT